MISKKIFLIALVALLGTVCAQRAAAQTGNVPVGKIAVIFSEAFQDSKLAIQTSDLFLPRTAGSLP